jgi:peptidyl-prolyl cis-trans isomerase C
MSVLPRLSIVFLLATAGGGAFADGRTLVVLPGVVVTSDDVADEVSRLPPPAQATALSRPAELARISQNIALRRELTRRGEAAGLAQDAKVAAALRAARERILSEAMLERAEGAPPEGTVLERVARNEYDAAPEKFDSPEQVRVRHILVSAKACDAEVKARDLLALAKQPGADFAALAGAHSDDPASAGRGGDLGFFARGRMKPEFETAAFALKQPGDLSDIVKTEFGYHVIRLEERKPAQRQPFEAVRADLVKRIAQREAKNRRQLLIDEISGQIQFDREAIEAMAAGGSRALR